MNGVNYYQVFSLSPTAGLDELKTQYRKLSLTYHPDRGGSTEQMAQLNEAYRVLSNPKLRQEYDSLRAQVLPVAGRDTYHYTQAQPVAHAEIQSLAYSWRWIIALVVCGVVLLAYDVVSTVIMPRYVTETPAAESTALTPSGDLTEEAAAALSEMQIPTRP